MVSSFRIGGLWGDVCGGVCGWTMRFVSVVCCSCFVSFRFGGGGWAMVFWFSKQHIHHHSDSFLGRMSFVVVVVVVVGRWWLVLFVQHKQQRWL